MRGRARKCSPRHLPAEKITGVLLYAHERRDGIDQQVRMFAPLYGITEDPATGSGNVALAGLLASLRAESDLKVAFRIGQGIDMGRPSLLEASAEKHGGKIIGLSIGGRCVPMMRGCWKCDSVSFPGLGAARSEGK